MNFKELLEDDLSNVFFNLEEFAEEHNIEGKVLTIIVDDDKLQEMKLSSVGEIQSAELLYYVKITDLDKEPHIGDIQRFDNKPKRILKASKDLGMYSIVLKGFKR